MMEQGSNKVNEMMDKIKTLMSQHLVGGITVGLLVATAVAYMLFKRYS